MSSFCQYLPKNRRRTKRQKKRSSSKKPPVKSFLSTIAPPGSGEIVKKDAPPARSTTATESENQTIDAQEYSIFHIDTIIRRKLSTNVSSVPELEADLSKVLWILQNGGDPMEKQRAKQRANILRKRIQDLESTLELTFYIFRTADILEEYRSLDSSAGAKSFVSLGIDIEKQSKLSELSERYLRIAQDYIDIENISVMPKKMICGSCHGTNFRLSLDDDSIYICSRCYRELEILDDAPTFKDTDRVNMSSKYTYTRKGHFIDAVKRFMGTQNTDPKKIQSAVEVVQREKDRHNLTEKQGHKNSITKDDVYMFLSEQGLSNHYEDLNLLFHIITGVPCPDITDYVDVLYEDFDLQEAVLNRVKEETRINSLNVNYKLYKLLQRRGYPCRKDDFYILKTKTKEDEHDEKMKEAWEILNWEWIPTF